MKFVLGLLLLINSVSSNTSSRNATAIRLCRLEMQNGNCQQSLQRFYYSPRSGYCFLFKYTGCLGNENNFEYREECEEACRGVTACPVYDISQSPAGCRLVLVKEDDNLCPVYNVTCPSRR